VSLPAYNPHKSCPKCGHGFVSTKHVTFAWSAQDALRRRCDRCDYVWDERPRDSKAAA
jgi:ribosomal protein S27AE